MRRRGIAGPGQPFHRSANILSWSNPAFALQAAPAMIVTDTAVPDATCPYTNDAHRFYRVRQP